MSKYVPTLRLKRLDHTTIPGIYGSEKNLFPRRMSFLHPAAIEKFQELQHHTNNSIVLSDMWRSSTASLRRKYPRGRLPRRGVAKPAFSAHNYGLAIDVAVDATLTRTGFRTKEALDIFMAQHGWFCHRPDHRRGREDWHYNFLGSNAKRLLRLRPPDRPTSDLVEAKIKSYYRRSWRTDTHTVQAALRVCGLYEGEVDGIAGPHTKAAMRAFQRALKLRQDGVVGPITARVLWYRAAELTCPALSFLWQRHT